MDSVGASKRTSTPQVLFWTTGGGFKTKLQKVQNYQFSYYLFTMFLNYF